MTLFADFIDVTLAKEEARDRRSRYVLCDHIIANTWPRPDPGSPFGQIKVTLTAALSRTNSAIQSVIRWGQSHHSKRDWLTEEELWKKNCTQWRRQTDRQTDRHRDIETKLANSGKKFCIRDTLKLLTCGDGSTNTKTDRNKEEFFLYKGCWT